MSVKACVIGIDGGGTKTHLLCTSLEGDVLAEVYGGALVIYARILSR